MNLEGKCLRWNHKLKALCILDRDYPETTHKEVSDTGEVLHEWKDESSSPSRR